MTEDKTAFLEGLKDRIAEIEKLAWPKIAELGQKYGIEKDSEGTWKDKAEAIAIAEAEEALTDPEAEESAESKEATPTEAESMPKKNVGAKSPEVVMTYGGAKYVETGQPVRTGLNGEILPPRR